MKKRYIVIPAAVLIAAAAAGTVFWLRNRIPAVPEETEIAADLPDELKKFEIDGDLLVCGVDSVTVVSRDTRLTRQTDDVDCEVALSGPYLTAEYPVTLHYAYVRDTGWTIRDYEVTDTPEIRVVPDNYLTMQRISAVNELEGTLGYTSAELSRQTWDESTQSYTQVFTVTRSSGYAEESGEVEYDGTLTPDSTGFRWSWQVESGERDMSDGTTLGGTVWHCVNDAEDRELAFSLTEGEDGALSAEGILRTLTDSGAEDRSFSGAVSWTVSEYDCVSFELPIEDGTVWTCSYQEGKEWLSANGVYAGELEEKKLTGQQTLENLLKLQVPVIVEPEPSQDTEQPGTEPEQNEEQPEDGGSGWDSWKDFLDDLLGIFR